MMLHGDSISIREGVAQLCSTAAAEALAEGILRHPSILARLIHIAGLRSDDPGSGELLGRMHLEIFIYWLGLSLRQKQRDAGVCCGTSAPDAAILRKLRGAAEGSIPRDALKPERELFRQDIELVVALLANGD